MNNNEEIIWFRDQPFVLLKPPLPIIYSNFTDTDLSFMISLHTVEKSVSEYDIELWIKWNGIGNSFQLIHVHDACTNIINSNSEEQFISINFNEIHDYIHAYVKSHNVPQNGLAYAINGVELALEISQNSNSYNTVGM